MKYIYVLFTVVILGISGYATVRSAHAASKVIEETVRSKNEAFRRDIKIEISPHDEARIENVYLEHQRKKKKAGEKDYLYVHGSVKNTSISIISGINVIAEFFDDKGNLLARANGEITPRIIERYGRGKGYFTVKTEFNPAITQCKLKLLWHGQDDF